jgi:hypothetical protein
MCVRSYAFDDFDDEVARRSVGNERAIRLLRRDIFAESLVVMAESKM